MSNDQILVVVSDRVPISHNRTITGAAQALADDIRGRMSRLGNNPITDDEYDLIMRAAVQKRHLDINIQRRLPLEVPGIPVERIHQIALAVARDYYIRPVIVKD